MKKFALFIIFVFLVACKTNQKITYVKDPSNAEMDQYYRIKDRTGQQNAERNFYYNTRQFKAYSTGKKYNFFK